MICHKKIQMSSLLILIAIGMSYESNKNAYL